MYNNSSTDLIHYTVTHTLMEPEYQANSITKKMENRGLQRYIIQNQQMRDKIIIGYTYR